MMRPFTLICMVSAFSAGLYLYQSKHQAQMLDREIGRTIKLTESTRERTGVLRSDWAMLNEPDRLAELAKAHTSLQTLKPTQFAALNDLAARLPPPAVNNRERLPVEAEPEEPPPLAAQAAPAVVVSTPAPVKPREVASVVEPKTKPEAKPAAVAEAKPVVHHVEKPAVVAAAVPAEPVPMPLPAPSRVRPPHPQAEIANNDATAPGTVGAAVLRAMRAQNAGTSYAPPGYAQPGPAQAVYAQPAYSAPALSVLGGRTLPPPVPFAAR